MYLLLLKNDMPNSRKKFVAIIQDQGKIKKIRFGDKNYDDYTMHHDDSRKQAYINRHEKREDWNNIKTAGCLAYHLLWSKPTIEEAIKDFEKRFDVHVQYV